MDRSGTERAENEFNHGPNIIHALLQPEYLMRICRKLENELQISVCSFKMYNKRPKTNPISIVLDFKNMKKKQNR